jgi:hypothetical protein
VSVAQTRTFYFPGDFRKPAAWTLSQSFSNLVSLIEKYSREPVPVDANELCESDRSVAKIPCLQIKYRGVFLSYRVNKIESTRSKLFLSENYIDPVSPTVIYLFVFLSFASCYTVLLKI